MTTTVLYISINPEFWGTTNVLDANRAAQKLARWVEKEKPHVRVMVDFYRDRSLSLAYVDDLPRDDSAITYARSRWAEAFYAANPGVEA